MLSEEAREFDCTKTHALSQVREPIMSDVFCKSISKPLVKKGNYNEVTIKKYVEQITTRISGYAYIRYSALILNDCI